MIFVLLFIYTTVIAATVKEDFAPRDDKMCVGEINTELCSQAYNLGFTASADSQITDKLKEDLSKPFNAWKALDPRPPVPAVGGDTIIIKAYQTLFETWATELGHGDDPTQRQTTLPGGAGQTIQSLLCKFVLKDEDKQLRQTAPAFESWTGLKKKTAGKPWEGVAPFDKDNLYSPEMWIPTSGTMPCNKMDEQPGFWYYIGSLAGWLDSQDDGLKNYYGKRKLKIDLTYSFDVTPGARQRGGGWHIDGSYSEAEIHGTKGACSPLYFVVTSDFPTMFWKGDAKEFISAADKSHLEKGVNAPFGDSNIPIPHGCQKPESNNGHPGNVCNGAGFVHYLFGQTYQDQVVYLYR